VSGDAPTDVAEGVFGAVVIDLQPAVLGAAGQRRPVGERLADGLRQAALRRRLRQLRLESPLERRKQRRGLAC
jgi:hypothetical protein